jgi:hypothetical protein
MLRLGMAVCMLLQELHGEAPDTPLVSPLIGYEQAAMPYAIIRGKNGRRHEVDFGDDAVRVEIHFSDEIVGFSSKRIRKPTRRSVGALPF